MKQVVDVFELSLLAQREAAELLTRHRRRVAENTLLPSSTPEQRDVALRGYSDTELLARAKRASPATIRRMETRAAAAFSTAEEKGVSVWTLVEERSGNYNSWYTFKAGVQRHLEDCIVLTMQQLDHWRRRRKLEGPSFGLDAIGSGHVAKLQGMSIALEDVPLRPPLCFKGDGKAKRQVKNSKSISIRAAGVDWREHAANSMAGDLRRLFLLQCSTGCRPQELANGVQARLLRDGTMVTRVRGAKCDDFVGQPSRCMRLATTDGVALLLARLLMVGRTLDSRNCNLGLVNTYAKNVARACAKAFPKRRGKKTFSPYSARHQFKADLVTGGWSKTEIAMAMGHSTTRSGTAYGKGGRGGGGAIKPVAIKALRSVRLRGAHPQARSGPAMNATISAQTGMPRRSPLRR